MKKFISILILILYTSFLYSQVRTTPSFDEFNPIYQIPIDAGTTLIGGSLLGKEIIVNDASDGSPHTLIIYTPSADSSAFPDIANNLAIGSTMIFNLKSIGDTIYIRSDDGVNGIVGAPGFPFVTEQKITLRLTVSGWVNDDRIFYANSLSEIENIDARPGDIITVRNTNPIANFIVRGSSVNTRYIGTAERKLKNGYYALVQPVDNKYHVNHFGAIAGDDIADDFYIQEAINFILEREPNTLAFGPGIYTIDTGIVMARTVSPTDRSIVVSFETIHLTGIGPSYGTFNATTLECRNNNGFAVAVQSNRNSSIKNMSIHMETGVSGLMYRDTFASYTTTELRSFFGQYVSTDETSPNALIVVDPFGANAPATQYSLWGDAYNSSLSATSMLHIDGVSLAYGYVGISINPLGLSKNGDNIRWTNSFATSLGIVWETKSSQSRQNSIDNIYLLSCGTFVDNKGAGTPPSIRNVNGAGTIREIFNISTGFGPIRMDNCYWEGILSFGRMDATYTSINQSQFKFAQYSQTGTVGLAGYGNAPVYFNDCSIQYFFNAANPVPLMFDCDYVEARRCHIETGIWLNSSLSDGTSDLIRMYDCEFYAPYNSGGRDFSLKVGESKSQITETHNGWVSGKYSFSEGGWSYSGGVNFPWRQVFLEAGVTVTKDDLGGDTLAFRFTTSNPGMYQIHDNLITDANLLTIQEQTINEFFLGRVVKIVQDTIWVGWGPYNRAPSSFSSTINLFTPYYYTKPFWGDVTISNDTIKNVYGYMPNVGVKYFDIDYDDYFDAGAYVVATGSNWVKMSHAAKKSGSDIRFSNYHGSVSGFGSNPGTGYVTVGARWSNTGISGVDYLLCIKGGIFNDVTNPPLWDTIYNNSLSYADINLIGQGVGGLFDPILTLDSNLIINGSQIIFEEEDGTDRGALIATEFQFGNVFNDAVAFTTGLVTLGKALIGDTLITQTIFLSDNGDIVITETGDIYIEQDSEFKVSFGRDKGEETDVDLNVANLFNKNHLDFEYFSKVSGSASSNNTITLSDGDSPIRHMVNLYVSSEDDNATYDVELSVNGDSLIIRDTIVTSYDLQDNQTVHVKSVVLNGNRYYKIINPEKKGSYTNSSGSNQTVITITHNLGVTPNIIYITPTTDVGTWYVSNKNTTEIEITMSTGLANTASLQWFVDR